MTPDETIKLISFVGGDSEFARLLGIDKGAGYKQRVNNWKRRGIPAEVVLEHYETIKKIRAKAAQRSH